MRKGIGHGTHNSSKRLSHQKVGMSKVAYHRMLVGGLDVMKRANAETREKCNEIVLSMCTALCGSMEAKALSFVLRAASSEHYKSSTRHVFTYVVGGRVGMNDTCYFTLDMKKLDPTPPHPLVLCILKYVLLLTCTSSAPPHPISVPY